MYQISNFELTEPINLIGYIESKTGSVRANHYHPQQEQKCLFTKGQIIEIYKDILSKFTDEEMDNTGPMFIEQFLLYHYLKNFRVDVDYITTGWKNPNTLDYQMLVEKFIHFMDYDRDTLIDDKINYLAKLNNIKL